MANSILFLNTPIASESEDIIGISSQVSRLEAAIDSDSQMIAVTSPFGSGKTSLIELLQEKRKKTKTRTCFLKELFKKREHKQFCKRERIVKISMWSQLQEGKELTSTDLHRTFLCQLIDQVNPARAEYVKNCLNPNNGILALHTNRPFFWVVTVVVLLFAIAAWIFNSFSEELKAFLPQVIMDNSSAIATGCFLAALISAIIILTRARILYSFRPPEQGRAISVNEIIDLYRAEVLRPQKHCLYRLIRLYDTRYIVVIEDLDRSTNKGAIISFLTELRKYCCSETSTINRNRVTFVVNIKPEILLSDHNAENDAELLYEKIFDFILNLQTVNVDNYDTILEGLLKAKEKELVALKFNFDPKDIVRSIDGMQWIIREKCNGIREIKDRLNTAFSLYETLTSNFKNTPISFETCAAVAFLTTAFPSDLYSLTGNEFDSLVDRYIQNPSADYHACDTILGKASEPFKISVWQMIQSKIIDSSYRSYFYSYPKDSKVYTSGERKIIDAILYNAKIPDLDETIINVENTSCAFRDAFRKAEQLKILLPNQILESEALYVETMKHYPEGLMKKLNSLDYSGDGAQRTIQTYKRILAFDRARSEYSAVWANRYCNIWEDNFGEEASILQIREFLCQNLNFEIHWYKPLFFDPHVLISNAEMDCLKYADIFELINFGAKGFTLPFIQYIQARFLQEDKSDTAIVDLTYTFFQRSLKVFGSGAMSNLMLEFMLTSNHIYPDFESEIVTLIVSYDDVVNGARRDIFSHSGTMNREDINALAKKYKELVNQVILNRCLSNQTLQYIHEIEQFDGYSVEVGDQLRTSGYCMDYILISLTRGTDIPFSDEDIVSTVKLEYQNLLERHSDLFVQLREQILRAKTTPIFVYAFLFGADCPIMSQSEISLAIRRADVDERTIISLIPPSLVKEPQAEMLCKYFCRQKQVSMSFEILTYIAKFEKSIAKALFLQLDFDMIRYRFISKAKKVAVKQQYKAAMDLDTTVGKLTFMEKTKFLDDAWEKEMAAELKIKADLFRKYISIVNSCEKITANTVKIVSENPIFPMSPVVSNRLFTAKKYGAYVSAKTGWDKAFSMETGARGDVLWPEYLRIFSSDGFEQTRGYMIKNISFLERIRDEHAYGGLAEENMLQMTGIDQNEEIIKYVSENYSVTFLLKYFSQIHGFKNRIAAEAYLEVVKSHEPLKSSDALYGHTYEKLVDGYLKGSYTRMRNKD